MIEEIVSGGQTGVDQAALYIATEIGIKVGGWCPKGGVMSCNRQFNSYAERTKNSCQRINSWIAFTR